MAVLSAVLAGGFGGDKGAHQRKGFVKLLLRIVRGEPAEPVATNVKENQRSLIQRLLGMGARQK